MATTDERLYEYAVVRYVPRVDREEFVNIGLLMMCKRCKWLKGEICLDEHRLRAFDPRVDMESLRAQASIFMRDDVPSSEIPVEERYRWLTAVKSAVLQVSPSHPGVIPARLNAETGQPQSAVSGMVSEFERLFRELVSC